MMIPQAVWLAGLIFFVFVAVPSGLAIDPRDFVRRSRDGAEPDGVPFPCGREGRRGAAPTPITRQDRRQMIGTAFFLLLGLLALSVPVGAVLGIMGLALGEIYSDLPLWLAIGEVTWSANSSFTLFALPLFVLLGEILLHAGIAERMYAAPGPLDGVDSGRSDAFQHRRLHHVRGHVRVQLGDGRHRRYGGDGSGKEVQVQRGSLLRLHCQRRNPGDPDPSVHQPDSLWRPDGHVHPEALPRRHAARPRGSRDCSWGQS